MIEQKGSISSSIVSTDESADIRVSEKKQDKAWVSEEEARLLELDFADLINSFAVLSSCVTHELDLTGELRRLKERIEGFGKVYLDEIIKDSDTYWKKFDEVTGEIDKEGKPTICNSVKNRISRSQEAKERVNSFNEIVNNIKKVIRDTDRTFNTDEIRFLKDSLSELEDICREPFTRK